MAGDDRRPGPRGLLRVLGLAAGVVLGAAACTYAPHPGDGQLRCSLNAECPEGFTCGQAKTCVSSPADPAAPLGGSALSVALLDRYAGNWAFDPGSSFDSVCTDGFSGTQARDAGQVLQIDTAISLMLQSVADLDSLDICELYLRLDSGGAHLRDAKPTCSNSNDDPTPDPVSTWTARNFDFVTGDGVTGKHTATYDLVENYADGRTVFCALWAASTLTKQ